MLYRVRKKEITFSQEKKKTTKVRVLVYIKIKRLVIAKRNMKHKSEVPARKKEKEEE